MRGRVGILAPNLQTALDEVATAEREGMPIQSSPEALKLQSAGLVEMRVQSWRPEAGPPWERATLTPAGRAVHEARLTTLRQDASASPSRFALARIVLGSLVAAALVVAAGLASGIWDQWGWAALWSSAGAVAIDRTLRWHDYLRCAAGIKARGELELLVPEALRREEWDA
jgi:hypothetical protein